MEKQKIIDAAQIPPQDVKEKTKDEEILELAKKELMREVKCASIRAEQYGAHSWAKPTNYRPSQRFLKHMLMNASNDHERREKKRQDFKQREIDKFRRHDDRTSKNSNKRRKINDSKDLSHSEHKHRE